MPESLWLWHMLGPIGQRLEQSLNMCPSPGIDKTKERKLSPTDILVSSQVVFLPSPFFLFF